MLSTWSTNCEQLEIVTRIFFIHNRKFYLFVNLSDCPLKMFKYPTSVRKHFKKFHGKETPFFCKTCTLVFKSSTAVQNHMENEHGIANIVVVNNVVQNPMTSTPTPGKIQTLKIKVRVYVIFLQRISYI